MRKRRSRHRAYKCMRKSCPLVPAVPFGCAPERYMQTSWHPKTYILDPLSAPWGTSWEAFWHLFGGLAKQ